MIVTFTIPGRPVPFVRTRRGQRYANTPAGRKAAAYFSYKEAVANVARLAGVRVRSGPVRVIVIAYVEGKRRWDIDNLGKAICDSLNGVAYFDDRQIVEVGFKVESCQHFAQGVKVLIEWDKED